MLQSTGLISLFPMTVFAAIALFTSVTYPSPISDDYAAKRSQLLLADNQKRIGAKLVLSPDERIVNDIFMKEKNQLIDESRLNRTVYAPSLSFYLAKPKIENSTLLKLIRKMPKGAALHLHDTSAASLDWLIKNATYRDNIYMCVTSEKFINFRAFLSPPSNSDCVWKSVKEERARATDVEAFDQHLKRNLSLLASDPLTTYVDNADVWKRFVRYFWQVQYLVYYAPIFRDYFWRTLEEFRADNVQYIELRSSLEGVYELDGTVHDEEFALQIYKNTTEEFVKKYPDFSGAKIIMSGLRNSKYDDILAEVKTAMNLHKKYPTTFMGYDLVGNEAFFNPIRYYLNALLYPASQDPPYKLPYFFHVGETNWQGTDTDDNMVEAILLNASRIGHGYALPKRPALLEIVREKNIPVEVNPICNQMLRLVSDLRNHPMAYLIANGFAVVIGSDDMAVWEALPLSHDIYMAFTTMSSQDADLTFLKQLAINSITYSSMNATEKDTAMNLWQKKWSSFIQEIVQQKPTSGHVTSSATTICSETLAAWLAFVSLLFTKLHFVNTLTL